jgi:exonuclease SbcD
VILKILHTSDWHLGKTIHGQDLTQDQIFVLDQIEKEVGKGYSALIIAGDIYDRSVPPSQTVEILGSFIDRITENGIEVVMIPGNHDSPSRLDFASGVLRRSGMHVRCRTEETSRPILIRGKNNETVQIFALPFVEESQVRTDHPESGVRTHEDAVRYLISGMHENKIPDIPSILVAHEYTGRGLIRSDSERELLLGNQGLVDAEIFAGFDYVALGHLHRPQCASGSANAYYSGSIMPYSFSEADHRKLMYSLRISEGRIEKSDVEIKLLKKFSVLEGRMEDLVTSPE